MGVFPYGIAPLYVEDRLPHARGGVSTESRRTLNSLTVFPTHVGVFLMQGSFIQGFACLPHARGGVSRQAWRLARACGSSPRTWGCFSRGYGAQEAVTVFPTHVGVFPATRQGQAAPTSLPHARGGVSTVSLCIVRSHKSSPRTWGCFLDCRSCVDARKVFPTHVGVFPGRGRHCRSAPCLPHARGGVSLLQRRWLWPSTSSPRTWGCF